MWTNEVHAEAVAAIDRLARCPDLAAVALVIAWRWFIKKPEVGIESHVWYAVMAARKGRDLPGIGTGTRDAMRHSVQGAGMGEMADKRPGPDEQVACEEIYKLLMGELTEREREAAELYQEGRKNLEVANALQVTQGRATQIRQGILMKFKKMSE